MIVCLTVPVTAIFSWSTSSTVYPEIKFFFLFAPMVVSSCLVRYVRVWATVSKTWIEETAFVISCQTGIHPPFTSLCKFGESLFFDPWGTRQGFAKLLQSKHSKQGLTKSKKEIINLPSKTVLWVSWWNLSVNFDCIGSDDKTCDNLHFLFVSWLVGKGVSYRKDLCLIILLVLRCINTRNPGASRSDVLR